MARKYSEKRKPVSPKFFRAYHALAEIQRGIVENPADIISLVNDNPRIAAGLYLMFRDPRVGGAIVERYSEHPQQEMRDMAEVVGDVLKNSQNSARLVQPTALGRLENETDDWAGYNLTDDVISALEGKRLIL